MDTTQTRLLDAAGQVFADKGFEAATVRDICKRADVQNIAAVNYYFGDKETLYNAAVKQAFHSETDKGPPEWPAGTPPAQKLRDFIAQFMAGLIGQNRPEWHFHLMARELAQPSHGGRAFVADFARPHFDVLLGILGEIIPDAAPIDKHLIAISIIGQGVHHRCGRTIIAMLVGDEVNRYTAEVLAEHISVFSLRALGLEALSTNGSDTTESRATDR